MDTDRFWNLFAKKLAGEATEDELRQLRQLLQANPQWFFPAETLQQLWHATGAATPSSQAAAAFERHLHTLKQDGLLLPQATLPGPEAGKRGRRVKHWWISASVLAVVLCGVLIWKQRGSGAENASLPSAGSRVVATRPGAKTTFRLADGTVVWLNAGSWLTYSPDFGQRHRNVRLTGEAFFDVRKSRLPFIIEAGHLHIAVLGTVLNVKSYPDEPTTETTLLHGRVEVVLDKRPGEKFILHPNEKLIVANEPAPHAAKMDEREPLITFQPVTRRQDSLVPETAWVDNKLIFEDESFSSLARKMERWFNVTIHFEDEKLARQRLSGTFTNETIQQALEALQLTTRFQFTINANKVLIKP